MNTIVLAWIIMYSIAVLISSIAVYDAFSDRQLAQGHEATKIIASSNLRNEIIKICIVLLFTVAGVLSAFQVVPRLVLYTLFSPAPLFIISTILGRRDRMRIYSLEINRLKEMKTGPAGEKGETGATGERGLQGETGTAGAAGVTGIAGRAGRVGDEGETGATGRTGLEGERGQRGQRGEPGETGTNAHP